jgi:hypothetical protein
VTKDADHQAERERGQRDVQVRLLGAAKQEHPNTEPYI